MDTIVEEKSKSFLSEMSEVCLKAAAATVGVLGAFALVSELGRIFGNSTAEDQKTEE